MKRGIGVGLYWLFMGLAVLIGLLIVTVMPIMLFKGEHITNQMWSAPITVLWMLWFARLSRRYLMGERD